MAGGGGNKQKRVKEGRVEGREAESGKRGGAGWGGDRDTRREGCVSARACFRKIKGGGDGGGRCLRPGEPWRLGTGGESQARPFHVTQLVFVGGFGKGKPPGW